ncbi:glutamine--fructose-6-phosphate aminotransferase [isomerizing] [Campylobacterota bacterium]|nr:glutamine--fructose-6-phosphate aminotransferase [isomerizing] [Campylobacterota bacterium]GHV08573.1 glutamine--fructose-6-phosphate aminotransferase [isomerizing] [Campylobacterota bacterium]
MCGIVGFIGSTNVKKTLLDGLKELEYRGYDSAGMAVMQSSKIDSFKAVGKLANLVAKTAPFEPKGFAVGIAHTRWATHGKPTEINAHPHQGRHSYIVHNGIIENYLPIKEELTKQGVGFLSQTDTEVIVHLYESFLTREQDAYRAFEQTIEAIEGAYAILLIDEGVQNTIFFAKKGSPLQIGDGDRGRFFASSDAPLIGICDNAIYLEDGSWGWATAETLSLFVGKTPMTAQKKPLPISQSSAQKEGFRFFMEKEIYEQSKVMSETLMSRVMASGVRLDELPEGFFDGVESLRLCACGTSYHAALAATYLFERLSRIEARAEIASEFHYRDPMLRNNELFIVISQSGETADTLEALKMAKRSGLKTLAICNVDNSSIVREADAALLTRAGIEKGVASTKAFATQTMVLWLLALFIAQKRGALDEEQMTAETNAARRSVKTLMVQPDRHEQIKRLSKRYLHGHGFFFIGRDLFYPLALEGALKLKEISYMHAEGYPAGEMKHGPIALADSKLFTIALMPHTLLREKMRSNVEELIARDTTLLAITSEHFAFADDVLQMDERSHPMLEFFEMMVAIQLLALEIAIRLGNDVDMPRNLAKSVTVE